MVLLQGLSIWRPLFLRLLCNALFGLNISKLCFLLMFGNHSLEQVATSMRRAGADVIISYFTPKLLNLIKN